MTDDRNAYMLTGKRARRGDEQYRVLSPLELRVGGQQSNAHPSLARVAASPVQSRFLALQQPCSVTRQRHSRRLLFQSG